MEHSIACCLGHQLYRVDVKVDAGIANLHDGKSHAKLGRMPAARMLGL